MLFRSEMVIAQLQRNELGVPDCPITTTIPARWLEGPTVRRAPGAGHASQPRPAAARP